MRIAIVGAGISGLSAAYVLSDRHDVTLFEREDRLGGHAHTVVVKTEDAEHRVDTGFLVFNDDTYPHFIALLERLGVTSKKSVMSFSYHDMNSGLEWKGSSLNTVFAQRRNLLNPRFVRMVLDILSFNRTLRALMAHHLSPELTLDDVLKRRAWSREFEEWYLLPMGAAIWSTNPHTFAEIPARTFAEFFSRHGLLNVRGMPVWRTIEGGSVEYVRRIEEHVAARGVVRCASPVRAIRRGDSTVEVTTDNVSSLQSIPGTRQFLVSLNSDHLIDPTKVIERLRYSHPVLDQSAVAAQQDRHMLAGNRTSFCGAYFGYGFHEDGIRSALEVCEALGVSW